MSVPPTSDQELVRRIQQGDAEAFGHLYDRYVDDVYRFFYYRTFNRQEAEDLTEDTFLRAWEHIGRLQVDRPLHVKAWLLRIARNLWIDRHRTRRERVSLESLPTEPPSQDSPEGAAIREEQWDWLVEALAQLPEPMREVVIYRFMHGLKPAEIAELMGIQVGHVRVLQHRALRRLQRWLKAQGIMPED